MIKNIIFDLGGVILDLDRDRVIDAYNALGFPEADALLNNFLQKGVFKHLEQGTGDRYALYEYIRSHTGTDIPAWKIDDALNNFITGLSPYKLRMLECLHTDYSLYVLSNTNEIMLPEIDRIWFGQYGRNMADYFDRVFLSYKMKMLKPDAEIFTRLATEARIKPVETLFIDDGQYNIEAAAALGFHVYQPSEGEDLRAALSATLDLPDGYFQD